MTDPGIQFMVVRLLEQAPATAEQLWLKGSGQGLEKSLKTYRRALDELEDQGMRLGKSGQIYSLPRHHDYCESLAILFKNLIEAKSSWRSVTYGDVDRKYLSRLLLEKPAPAELLWRLLSATVESRSISFLYAPQHPETRRHLRWMPTWFDIRTPKGMIPVKMVPHYLVFSGQHFIVLGESHIGGEIDIRQYEFAGIKTVELAAVTARTLEMKPSELYRHSVNVWIGGDIHEIQLEDLSDPAGNLRVTKVNGEDEILSYVVASLGNIRIVDPPEAIIARATKLQLPLDVIFRITKKRKT